MNVKTYADLIRLVTCFLAFLFACFLAFFLVEDETENLLDLDRLEDLDPEDFLCKEGADLTLVGVRSKPITLSK